MSVPVQSTSSSAAAPAVPDPEPTVRVQRWPAALVVDGSGAEWERADEKEAPAVSIAFSERGIAVIADLRGQWREGLWVGIGSIVPGVPSVGELFQRSGAPYPFDCEHETVRMFEGQMAQGAPRTPEAAARCRAFIARYEADVRTHQESFSRRLRITPAGIDVFAPDGARIDVPVTARASEVDGRAIVEAELPIGALPRLSESPLSSARVAAVALSRARDLDAEGRWTLARLPTPVRFEPYGELRDRAFALLHPSQGDPEAVETFPSGLSYHPTDPSHVRSVRHPEGAPTSIVAKDELLYRRLHVAGDVEIGLVDAYAQSLAIFVKGKLLRLLSFHGSFSVDYAQPVRIRGVVERAGAMHLIVLRPWHSEPMTGSHPPNYQILAIDSNGAVVSPVTQDGDGTTWSDLAVTTREIAQFPIDQAFSVDFTNPALDTLGLRGVERDIGTGDAHGFESIWKWNPTRKRYVQSYRKTPLPPGFDPDPERSRPPAAKAK